MSTTTDTAPAGASRPAGQWTTELDVEIIAGRRILLYPKLDQSAGYVGYAGGGWLMGWSVAEASGTAAAKVRLHHGRGTSSDAIATVSVATSDSKDRWLGDRGIDVPAGVYVELVSGAADVTLWIRPQRH